MQSKNDKFSRRSEVVVLTKFLLLGHDWLLLNNHSAQEITLATDPRQHRVPLMLLSREVPKCRVHELN